MAAINEALNKQQMIMELVMPQLPQGLSPGKNTLLLLEGFQQLITALSGRSLPPATIEFINREIAALQPVAHNQKKWGRKLRVVQNNVLAHLEKELKLVPKNYYRNMWLPLGMTAFGLPLGVGVGLSLGNIGLLGLGLPIGLGIGVALGTRKDKKAAADGRQLDVIVR